MASVEAKMVGSVNTNIGAQIALRNLNLTDADLSSVQKKISTGLRVSDANDNGAVFAIAQGLRSDVSAITRQRTIGCSERNTFSLKRCGHRCF
jgi:hypothetical protein